MNNIKIKNFQSIKDIDITTYGYTVINGVSDTGKSSFVRAIKFLMDNKFKPSFIRTGEKSLYISLNGIERKKSSSDNSYTYEGTKYNKVGTNVPDFLSDVGLSTFKYNDGEDNTIVVPQYKPLFLVNESIYVQTKIFQSIFGVSEYEEAVRKMKADVNSMTVDNNKKKDFLKTLQRGINDEKVIKDKYTKLFNSFETAEKCDDYLASIDELKHLLEKESKVSKIISSLNNIVLLHEKIKMLNDFLDLKSSVLKDKNVLEKHTNSLRILNQLLLFENFLLAKEDISLMYSRSKKFEKISTINKLCDKVEFLNLLEEYYSVLAMKRKSEKIKTLLDIVKRMYSLMAYNSLTNFVKSSKDKIKSLEDSVRGLKDSLPEVCECCNQPLNKDLI